MDTIDRNQPQGNYSNLLGTEAIERIDEMVKKAETCFFCTETLDGASSGVRPMAVREVDRNGNLWFLSADDSRKNRELAANPGVRLFFQGSAHSDFLYLEGRASITRDRARIEALWSPIVKTWFTEGMDDPRITVIEFTPSDGYYWDTEHARAIAGGKMLVGAALGKTLDDSIQGRLRP